MKQYAFLLAGLLCATPLHAQEAAPLKTVVDGTFAPHAMPKLGAGYEGFNIDLAEEIAKRLKRKSIIDAVQFSGIVPALQAGTYDYVAAPTTVTKERADNMLFTEGYLNTDFQFLIKKGAPKVEKLEDLKGKIVSVNKGSAYDSWARGLAEKTGWKVESFGTQTDAVQAVLPLRPAAVLVNCAPARLMAGLQDDLNHECGDIPMGCYANIGELDATQRWRNTAEDPTVYADFAQTWLAAGARLIGGCCGTTPAHIARLRELIAGHS